MSCKAAWINRINLLSKFIIPKSCFRPDFSGHFVWLQHVSVTSMYTALALIIWPKKVTPDLPNTHISKFTVISNPENRSNTRSIGKADNVGYFRMLWVHHRCKHNKIPNLVDLMHESLTCLACISQSTSHANGLGTYVRYYCFFSIYSAVICPKQLQSWKYIFAMEFLSKSLLLFLTKWSGLKQLFENVRFPLEACVYSNSFFVYFLCSAKLSGCIGVTWKIMYEQSSITCSTRPFEIILY